MYSTGTGKCKEITIRYGTVPLGYGARCTVTATLGYGAFSTGYPP